MTAAAQQPQGSGDLIFCLFDRQDRISVRLNRKIERLSHRLTALEERRWP